MLLEIMSLFCKFFQHNWVATLYFNFRMLPFSQAIHLPFDFCHGVRFESLQGRVVLNAATPLHRAMVRVGGRGSDMFPRMQTVLSLDGVLEVLGDGVEIGSGCSVTIGTNAHLVLNGSVRLGAMTKVYCSHLIEIDQEVDVSWESQLFDTNFHYMKDLKTGEIIEPDGEVHIGSYNWIGNRCNIMKGTVTPAHLIVAANSLLNKDYSSIAADSMMAGQPAKVVKTGIRRMFEGKDL